MAMPRNSIWPWTEFRNFQACATGLERPTGYRPLRRSCGARIQSLQIRRILARACHGDNPAKLADPSLAPDGACILSAIVQYAPYALKEGWTAGKPKFLKAILAQLEAYAPGIGKSILHAELLTPADIERVTACQVDIGTTENCRLIRC